MMRNESKALIFVIGALLLAKFWDLLWVPVFFDEAIYLYQGEQVTKNVSHLFISFTEGTQFPLMTWALALLNVLTKPFISLLLSGRILTTTFDVLAGCLVFLIGKKLISTRYGALSALLYLSLPLTFLHSRFVMLEPLTNLLALGALYFTLCALESHRIRDYLLIGACLLLAFFTKPLAIVYFPALFFSPFVLSRRPSISLYKRLGVVYLVTGVVIGAVMVPLVSSFSAHTSVVTGVSQSLFATFKTSLHESWLWVNSYASTLILFVGGCALVKGIQQKKLLPFWCALWIAVVVVLDSIVGSHFYPRHLFPVAAPLALLAAWIINQGITSKRWLGYTLLIIIILPLWLKDISLLVNPVSSMVGEDRQQFYEDWSSGVGFKSLAMAVKEFSQKEPAGITLYVEEDRLTLWALPELFDLGNTRIRSVKNFPNSLGKNDYLVINRNSDRINTVQYNQVAVFRRYGQRSISLYTVKDLK